MHSLPSNAVRSRFSSWSRGLNLFTVPQLLAACATLTETFRAGFHATFGSTPTASGLTSSSCTIQNTTSTASVILDLAIIVVYQYTGIKHRIWLSSRGFRYQSRVASPSLTFHSALFRPPVAQHHEQLLPLGSIVSTLKPSKLRMASAHAHSRSTTCSLNQR